MSRQPEALGPLRYASVIRQAFLECDSKVPPLYRKFQEANLRHGWGLDLIPGPDAFRSWMNGESEPQATSFAVVCEVLNARLIAIGKEPMLPEFPIMRGPDGVPADGTRRVSKGDKDLLALAKAS